MADRRSIIESLDRAPDESLDEILDFIEFVTDRKARSVELAQMNSLQEASLATIWDNPDDDIWNAFARG